MSPAPDDCRRARDLLLDHVIEGDGPAWPVAARSHLDGCGDCRRYADGLEAARDLRTARDLRAGAAVRPPHYGPELRRRTLDTVRTARAPGAAQALEAALAPGAAVRAALLAVLVAAAAVAVFAGFVLPVWATARLLESLVAPGWTAVAVAIATCSSLGLVTVGPAALALMRTRRSGSSHPDPLLNGWR